VRTRCTGTVRALLEGGADVRRRNKSGSTPLHLAVQNTGRGGSGSPRSREEQAAIVRLLLTHGARWTDEDRAGKSVTDSASPPWTIFDPG
jgi:ankyrin repeat protein